MLHISVSTPVAFEFPFNSFMHSSQLATKIYHNVNLKIYVSANYLEPCFHGY